MSDEQRKDEVEVEAHHKKYLANDEAAEDSDEVEAEDEVEGHLKKYR
jgi:hypothetical protein